MSGTYLDHAASTPMRPEALAAVQEALELVGNPSGAHRWAREARRRLDDARDLVADALGARPGEVVFTSGGTEADDLAVNGAVAAARTAVPGVAGPGPGGGGGAPTAVCSAVEHHAVLEPVLALGGSTVAVDRGGRVDLDALADRLGSGPPVALVSVMLANNETGAVNDLEAVARVVRRTSPGTRLHTDAVAAAPWLDLATRAAPAQLVSVSGHKVGGPKGIGALVVREGTPIRARLLGGGQERERRSGTPHVAGAVGLAAALAATVAERGVTVARVEQLRSRLLAGLRAEVPDLVVVSPDDPASRTPGTVLGCVPGVDREALLFLLDEAGVGASWGSSCASGAAEPSHVLAAMGVAPELARGSLRLSLGWCSTEADVDHALAVVPAAVARLRGAVAPTGPSGVPAPAAGAPIPAVAPAAATRSGVGGPGR